MEEQEDLWESGDLAQWRTPMQWREKYNCALAAPGNRDLMSDPVVTRALELYLTAIRPGYLDPAGDVLLMDVGEVCESEQSAVESDHWKYRKGGDGG